MDKKNSRNWYAIAYPHPHVDIMQLIEESSIPNIISLIQPTKEKQKNLHKSQFKNSQTKI